MHTWLHIIFSSFLPWGLWRGWILSRWWPWSGRGGRRDWTRSWWNPWRCCSWGRWGWWLGWHTWSPGGGISVTDDTSLSLLSLLSVMEMTHVVTIMGGISMTVYTRGDDMQFPTWEKMPNWMYPVVLEPKRPWIQRTWHKWTTFDTLIFCNCRLQNNTSKNLSSFLLSYLEVESRMVLRVLSIKDVWCLIKWQIITKRILSKTYEKLLNCFGVSQLV